MSKVERKWPWVSEDEDDDYFEPYDELEDVKHNVKKWNDW